MADSGRTSRSEFDVFLLHAGEDGPIARMLAIELQQRRLAVWFDQFELRLGDNLHAKIDEALQISAAGVAIVSPAFLRKDWPQRELAGLVAREADESRMLILPVWHNVGPQDVSDWSPKLSVRLAANTASGLSTVADQIVRALTFRLDLVQPGEVPTALDPAGRPLVLGSSARTAFDLQIIEFNNEVLAHLAEHPQRLYDLSPRRFEELVAELYSRAGFEVELTPASGDEGVDVYAIRRDDLGSTLTVVQAKRYKPDLRVSVGQVRELFGTVNLQDASAGVLITTSSFEPGAEKLAAEHRWRLELRDYARLQEMLRAPLAR
jgi:hypothetical protein